MRQTAILFQPGRPLWREEYPRGRNVEVPEGTHGVQVETMMGNTRAMQRQSGGEAELNAPPTLQVIADSGETSPRARESALEGDPAQESLLDRQKPPPRRAGEPTQGGWLRCASGKLQHRCCSHSHPRRSRLTNLTPTTSMRQQGPPKVMEGHPGGRRPGDERGQEVEGHWKESPHDLPTVADQAASGDDTNAYTSKRDTYIRPSWKLGA